jgi:hypothetical protein
VPAYSQLQDLRARRLVYYSKWERNCVKNTFARAGFERTKNAAPDGGWTALWGQHSTLAELSSMNKFQRVNAVQRTERPDSNCRQRNLLRSCTDAEERASEP